MTILHQYLALTMAAAITGGAAASPKAAHPNAPSVHAFPTHGPDWKPTGKSVSVTAIPVGAQVRALGIGEGAVWVLEGRHVLSIDPSTARVTASFLDVPGLGLAVGHGSLWTTLWKGASPVFQRVDPHTRQILANIPGFGGAVAFGEDSVWVADMHDDYVARFDPTTSQRIASIEVGGRSSAIVVGAGAVWVLRASDNVVTRIDPANNQLVRAIRLGPGPWGSFGLAAGEDAVWAGHGYAVVRIDPKTNRVVRTIPLGVSPRSIAVAGAWVWAGGDDGSVSRIDPQRNKLIDQFSLTAGPLLEAAAGPDALWLVGGSEVYRIDL